ncbi:MAG TPA: T9SS type A sorting domain-containing protein [Candidatus Kapabacteria bacterium]|nr:T9SS type A sorting domain-containing protein [Candidatus Kapabacteria bacterium]
MKNMQGKHNFTLNSANIPSGLYFVLLQTRDEVITQKVMVMK